MTEKEGKKCKGGGKGFYRFSGLLDFFRPKAESKPKPKKAFYRYSLSHFRSPISTEAPETSRNPANREPRNSEGMLSPKKERRPVNHRFRHSDLEIHSEGAVCRSPEVLPKLPVKIEKRSPVKSPERMIQSPTRRPPLSPPSAGKRTEGAWKHDEKIHLQHRHHPFLIPKIEATATSPRHYLRNDHKAATPMVGCTPKSPQRTIQSPTNIPPTPSSYANVVMKDEVNRLLQRGQNVQHAEVEATPAMPAQGPEEDRLHELQNIHRLEDDEVQPFGGFYDDLPCILLSLLLAAIVTAVLVGHMTKDSFKDSTQTDRDYDDDGNRPFILVGGGKSLPFPTGTTEERKSTTHVCVYHGRQEGLTYELGGLAYSATTMPLDSCNIVLYCCAQLGHVYSPVQQAGDVGNFKKLWNVTANTRFWQRLVLIIGDGADDENGWFLDIIKDRQARETFVYATAKWCRHQGYSGVYLQWPRLAEFTWNEVVPVMVELQKLFVTRSLTLGTVVPQEEIQSNWILLYKLARVLGEASTVLKPTVYSRKHFTRWTFSYYTRVLLETLNATAQRMGPARRSLCFMAPAGAVAFTVSSSVDPENLEHLPAVGPAMSTGRSTVGHRSYTEACTAITNMTVQISSHAVLAVGNGLWLSFATKDSLGELFESLLNV